MHQQILKIKPGKLFKGYSSSIAYINNDHIVSTQNYYGTSIIDTISTKEQFFSKKVYTHANCPKYIIDNTAKIYHYKPMNVQYSDANVFYININKGFTTCTIEYRVSHAFNQIEVLTTAWSEKHVNFTSHRDNIDIARKSRNALKAFKLLLKNPDVINYLSEECKTGDTIKSGLFAKDPSKINLLYLLDIHDMSMSDFIVIDNLERDVYSY